MVWMMSAGDGATGAGSRAAVTRAKYIAPAVRATAFGTVSNAPRRLRTAVGARAEATRDTIEAAATLLAASAVHDEAEDLCGHHDAQADRRQQHAAFKHPLEHAVERAFEQADAAVEELSDNGTSAPRRDCVVCFAIAHLGRECALATLASQGVCALAQYPGSAASLSKPEGLPCVLDLLLRTAPMRTSSTFRAIVERSSGGELLLLGAGIGVPIAIAIVLSVSLLRLAPSPAVPDIVATPAPVASRPIVDMQRCKGLTMKVLGHEGDVVHVRVRDNEGAYSGDTSCSEALPVLCIDKANLAAPTSIVPGAFDAQTGGAFYDGWTGGRLKLSPLTSGTALTSRRDADSVCATAHGARWRMAEFHDGGGGWGFTGIGPLPADAVFWVAIADQPGNPWNFLAP